MLKVDDVLEILSIPLLGIVPESQEVLRASNLGRRLRSATPRARRRGPPWTRCAASRAKRWTSPSQREEELLGGLFTRRAA